jgi:predicted ATPase/DNA-binding winged helix-turn-helix (wHTH) protein
MRERYRFGCIEVRPAERQLWVDGAQAKVGARAFDLLLALIERRDRVVGKNELLDLVWPGLVVEENNLQVHISALRKLLGTAAIATIPGRGYRFTQVPDEAASDHVTAPRPETAASIFCAHVPALPTLLGREDDLEALRALVLAHPVVTVVGVGGVGKTVLARTLAQRIGQDFDHGACVIELAPLADPSLVATVAAKALDVKPGQKTAIEAITQALARRRMLLVLDNCEHLLQSVAEAVDSLRQAAPGVHWLVTSQEPTKLIEEQVYPLRPLALPAQDTLDAARRAGAVALFEARVRGVDPRFTLTERNVAAAADVCRQLDGIPLAIELAAARMPLLGLDGLRSRLSERLRVLAGGPRRALARHQTLRAALEWSYGLLTPEQQTVFRRLGVFAGSFSLETAQQVAADETIDRWAVLEDLGALIDKSLVVVEPEILGEPRYRLLETMRQYALDRLDTAGEGEATRARHLGFFVALAEQAKVELLGPQQGAWMRRLDLDHENMLAAHQCCAAVADGGERDLRLVIGLFRYWMNRALLLLGYRVTNEALLRPGAQRRDALRAEALVQSGRLGGRIGQYVQAKLALDEAIAIARDLGAMETLVDGLSSLGTLFLEQRDLARARAPFEEALALVREAAADSFAFERASTGMGELERLEGHWQAARPHYEASLGLARKHGRLRGIWANLQNLVMTAIAQGDVTGTGDLLREYLTSVDGSGVNYGYMNLLLCCAGIAAVQGHWRQAARFEAAATFHNAQMNWPLDPADQAFADSLHGRIRAALSDEDFKTEQIGGRALTFEQAVNEVRDWLHTAP